MNTQRYTVLGLCVILILTITLPFLSVPSGAHSQVASINETGPYLDKIVYSVITGDAQQVTALQSNQIDLISDPLDSTYIDTLEADVNIDVEYSLRNGYGSMIINTMKYPLNITEFRRAIAFALDKEGIADDVWDGHAEPLDSVIPKQNPFSCEGVLGLLGYSYYEADTVLGNQILEDAGFVIDGVSGYRLAPNGAPFSVKIEVAQSSTIAVEIGEKFEDALLALHVNATSIPTDFYDYLNRVYFHGDFDLVFLASSFSNFDVDWLAYSYWGDFADEPYYNYPGWSNATFDSWRDELLTSSEFSDVYTAAIEMQKIWIHACPEIICYQNYNSYAYRTDKFEGFVNSALDGVPSWLTNYQTKLQVAQGGPFGGTLRQSHSMDIDTFNIMVANTAYSMNILEMLYETLFRQGSQGEDQYGLAADFLTETHEDNSSIPSGHVRFTFEIASSVLWSDLTPLTAEDVAYSLNYYQDAPGNPYGLDLTEMTMAVAETPTRLVVEFSTESYWNLHAFVFKPILPKSLLLSLGLSGWNSWSPTYGSLVTSGPFYVSSYSSGEYCELTKNPYYYRLPDEPTTSTTTTTTSETTTETTAPTTYPVYENHGLEWGVSVDDTLDVVVTSTLSSSLRSMFGTTPDDSGSATITVMTLLPIPGTITGLLDIPHAIGTPTWSNGSSWTFMGVPVPAYPCAIPIGNWSLYTTLYSTVFTIVETTEVWGYEYTLPLIDYSLHAKVLYSKSTGFIALQLSEVYDSGGVDKVGEHRIQAEGFTVTSTTTTTTTEGQPLDMTLIFIVAGVGAIAVILVAVVLLKRGS